MPGQTLRHYVVVDAQGRIIDGTNSDHLDMSKKLFEAQALELGWGYRPWASWQVAGYRLRAVRPILGEEVEPRTALARAW